MLFKLKSFLLCLHELFIRRPNEYPENCPYFVEDVDPSEIAQRKLWLEFNYRQPCYDKTELDLDWYRQHPWDDPLA